jgi:hypothetical protein
MPCISEAGRPQPQRYLLELPAPSEIAGRKLRLAAVGVAVVEAAVLCREELARRQEVLLREQCRQQPGERAAALMKFHCGRSPRGERAGGLAAREAECLRHGLGIEAPQPSDGSRRAERSEHAGSVEAAGAERWIVEPDPDTGRHFRSGGNRDEQITSRPCVAFGNRQGRRDHLRSDVSHGGAMRVAHRDGSDEIAIEQSRAGEREAVAADHAAFGGLSEARRQRCDLLRLLALVAGERTGEGVEQQIFAVLFDLVRKLVIGQCGCKLCQHLRCFFRHQALL